MQFRNRLGFTARCSSETVWASLLDRYVVFALVTRDGGGLLSHADL